jgi:DNA-binding beta-propeller fold protein YncE
MFSNQFIRKVLEAVSYAVAVVSLLTILPALTVAQSQGTTYTISTAAGNGERGFAGDGGSAANAKLNQPTAVAIDRAGNLYIADSGNHRIRKVATDGTITTFAGTGERGFGGDGGLAVKALFNRPYGIQVDPQGNVLIADQGNRSGSNV